MATLPLSASGSVTLATVSGVVTGTVRLGPDANNVRGPASWHVTGVSLITTRPGTAPIPRAVIYQDTVSSANIKGLTYDGSFAQGASVDTTITRGSVLIAVWTGGTVGDVATMTLTGTKS